MHQQRVQRTPSSHVFIFFNYLFLQRLNFFGRQKRQKSRFRTETANRVRIQGVQDKIREFFHNPYRSCDRKASENKIDVLFFRADIAHSIHMQINAGWL